jgi:hypothetical protein
MPTIQQEEHFSGTSNISTLSLNFSLGTALSQSLRDEIQEVVIYREPRNSREKRRKLAQGFATNVYMGASEYEPSNDGATTPTTDSYLNRRGDVINSSFHFRKNFGFFNGQINSFYDMSDYVATGFSKSKFQKATNFSTHHGMYYSVKTLDESIESDTTINSGLTDESTYQDLDWRMTVDKFCFFSPETLLSDGVFLNPDSVKGAKFIKLAEATTTANVNTYKFDGEFNDTNSKRFLSRAASLNIHYNISAFTSYYTSGTEESDVKDAEYVNNGDNVSLPGLSSFKFDNSYGGKFMYLRLEDTIQQSTNTTGNVVDIDYARNPSVSYGNLTLFSGVGAPTVSVGTAGGWNTNLDFFEIENDLNNQYGRIESSQYTPIHNSKSIASTTFSNIYSGDTYITQYINVNKNLFGRYFTFLKLTTSNITFYKENFDEDADTRLFTKTRVFKSSYSPSLLPGSVYGSSVTYYVESDINTYFRYRNDNDVPYYPNSSIEEVYSALPTQEDNRNYNVQYSMDNTLKTTYVTRPIFDEAIENYPNRTIYSERSNEDEKVDNYQIFKQESIYDLPEETGEIIDTFVYNNEFYSHTPKALWRNFVNTLTKEASTIGEVVLGTGGLFTNPSQKVLTSDGGYGGTISQFGNAVTPFGYFFVDLLQRKVFKLTNNLEEISLQGMQQYFDENLITPTDREDNTFKFNSPKSISMGWDNEYKRILLTQHDDDNSFTISYSPVNQAWVSFHSYVPNTYLSNDRYVYSFINSNSGAIMHQHNVGDYGVYHTNPVEPMMIDVVSNKASIEEKVFDNYYVHSRSYERNGSFVNLDFFDTIECRNDYQDSGVLDILTTNDFNPVVANSEVLNRWKKSHYQTYIPRDNHQANLDNAGDWVNASRMKSKYLKSKFIYNNVDNREFVVNFIEYLFRIIAR